MGVKTKDISLILDISRVSVSYFLKAMSRVLVGKFFSNFKKIGGKGIIVEIDESKFGKVKYNRGHRVDGVWVFGAVERTLDRRIFLVDVPDRRKETLLEAIKFGVEKDSIIYSDCFRSYTELNNYFALHRTVNHSLNFVDPLSGVHTNTIEGNWAAIKSQTPVRNRTRRAIKLYLIRYMIRRTSSEPLKTLLNYLF